MTAADPIIGYRQFVDGTTRPVFLGADGRQYVIGSGGELVPGLWIYPEPEIPVPLVIAVKSPCN
jgi:hypothetical protein